MHSKKILDYHFGLGVLAAKINLPKNVEWLLPYNNLITKRIMKEYYDQYYGDEYPRILIFGINPGRFGSGITGIPFTDPKQLNEICSIKNDFPQKSEISAEFIHSVIAKFGGLQKFNSQFYISSLCPLGFINNGVNYNYYDDRSLQKIVTPFIIQNIIAQKKLVKANECIAYCLGEGKNFEFFANLNEKNNFFKSIHPLSHPRWIMQYRRKKMEEYIDIYIEKLTQSTT